MEATQFTKQELYNLRLACIWANRYWDEMESHRPFNEVNPTYKGIARDYWSLRERVHEVITAQESSTVSVG